MVDSGYEVQPPGNEFFGPADGCEHPLVEFVDLLSLRLAYQSSAGAEAATTPGPQPRGPEVLMSQRVHCGHGTDNFLYSRPGSFCGSGHSRSTTIADPARSWHAYTTTVRRVPDDSCQLRSEPHQILPPGDSPRWQLPRATPEVGSQTGERQGSFRTRSLSLWAKLPTRIIGQSRPIDGTAAARHLAMKLPWSARPRASGIPGPPDSEQASLSWQSRVADGVHQGPLEPKRFSGERRRRQKTQRRSTRSADSWPAC